MDVGIGLPAPIPWTDPTVIAPWARAAEEAGFSTLGSIDRLAYGNLEPLVALSVAAGATERIGLATTVLVAPLRRPGVLAKQAATLDAISGGRFTLGMGVGSRESDYGAAPAGFGDRGARFDDQLETMRRIWGGGPGPDGEHAVGPSPATPGGPRVLLGGRSDAAMARVGRYADGYIGSGSSAGWEDLYAAARRSWDEHGREGRPDFVGCGYVALGDDATVERGREYLLDYYGFMGDGAAQVAAGMQGSTDDVQRLLDHARELGVDELMLWPCVPELDQIERVAEVALG